MIVLLVFVAPLLVPMAAVDYSRGEARAATGTRPALRKASLAVSAGASIAMVVAVALPWWETTNSETGDTVRSYGQVGSSGLVTMTVLSFAVATWLRVSVTLRRVAWGAATIQLATWAMLAVGILVANPQLFGSEMWGELDVGWYVGVGATAFGALAGLLDQPGPRTLPPQPGPALERQPGVVYWAPGFAPHERQSDRPGSPGPPPPPPPPPPPAPAPAGPSSF